MFCIVSEQELNNKTILPWQTEQNTTKNLNINHVSAVYTYSTLLFTTHSTTSLSNRMRLEEAPTSAQENTDNLKFLRISPSEMYSTLSFH